MRQRGFALLGYVVIFFGITTLLAGGWSWIQGQRLDACNAQVESLKTRNAALTQANTEFKDKAEKQNKAIDALLTRAEKAEKEREAARKALQAQQARTRQRVAELDAVRGRKGTCGEGVQEVKKALRP